MGIAGATPWGKSEMSVAVLPAFVPRGSWLARRVLLLLMFLGLLSFVAVDQLKIECRSAYLLDDAGRIILDDAGRRLTTGEEQCYVTAGKVRLLEYH